MSEEEKVQWTFNYSLSEKCRATKLQDSNSVLLKTVTENGVAYLIGFDIIAHSGSEAELLSMADKQAKILADIISVKQGKYVSARRVGYHILRPNNINLVPTNLTTSVEFAQSVDLDMKDSNLTALMNSDFALNQRYHQAAAGLEAMSQELYETAITNFFQAINGLSSQVKKYKPLRDALSHNEQLRPSTVRELNVQFGEGYFELTKGGAFDHNSLKNRRNLKAEAERLKGLAMKYLANLI